MKHLIGILTIIYLLDLSNINVIDGQKIFKRITCSLLLEIVLKVFVSAN